MEAWNIDMMNARLLMRCSSCAGFCSRDDSRRALISSLPSFCRNSAIVHHCHTVTTNRELRHSRIWSLYTKSGQNSWSCPLKHAPECQLNASSFTFFHHSVYAVSVKSKEMLAHDLTDTCVTHTVLVWHYHGLQMTALTATLCDFNCFKYLKFCFIKIKTWP